MKMSLGAFIAQLRKEKGLTQKQLSEILGVSDASISGTTLTLGPQTTVIIK